MYFIIVRVNESSPRMNGDNWLSEDVKVESCETEQALEDHMVMNNELGHKVVAVFKGVRLNFDIKTIVEIKK